MTSAAFGRRPRDADRAAVYAAEDQVGRLLDRAAEFPVLEVAGSRLTLPPERRFSGLDQVGRYLDDLLAQDWVRRRWPTVSPVRVRQRRGTRRAHYEYDTATIALPPATADGSWALREMVVLHELAHHLIGRGRPGHGPAFRGLLLSLVEHRIGVEVAFVLRVAFADQGLSPAGGGTQ